MASGRGKMTLAWLIRWGLVLLAAIIWGVAMSIPEIPLQANFSKWYMRLYAMAAIALICALLVIIEYYIEQAQPRGPITYYYPGILVCFVLSLLFPLVVITHWVFCAKKPWNHWIVLPVYIMIAVGLRAVGYYLPPAGIFIRWRTFVICAAMFHMSNCLHASVFNWMGIAGAVFTIIAVMQEVSPEVPKVNPWHALFYMLCHLAAACLTVFSFVPMVKHIPGKNADMAELFSYGLSKIGAGKYVNVEYNCYETTKFYFVDIRKA